MNEDQNAVKANDSQAAVNGTVTPTETKGEAELYIAQLEDQRNKAIEEAANYKLGMLKAKGKATEDYDNETEDERIARIVSEKLAETKIAQIDQAKDEYYKKLARENAELKLASLNKTNVPPATVGSHSESQGVSDTLVTPEQLAAFKARGWSDKEIEKYKKNYQRQIGR